MARVSGSGSGDLTVHQGVPRAELFGLTSQFRRSASSIAANIAEGAGRGGTCEFVRYLRISAGSASEYETRIIIAAAAGFLYEQL